MLTPERVNNCVLLTLKVLITTLLTPVKNYYLKEILLA